jgi:hypothetical protein
MDISLYRTSMIQRIRTTLNTVAASHQTLSRPEMSRMRILLTSEVAEFLAVIGIEMSQDDAPGLYWDKGPEIRLPVYNIKGASPVSASSLTPADGGDLSPLEDRN